MFSLLNAALLPWLAAAGIPLVIHLLTRRARRRLDLPTVRFLQKTLAQQSHLFRWRHLLLLLLRTLAVLALVVAFTKPTLNAPLAAAGGERAGVVLVLDVSGSMAYTAGGLSSLNRARNEAMKALDSLRPGDRVNVVLCGAQPVAALSQPGEDHGAVRNALRTAQVTEERADLAAAINVAVEQLAKTNARARRLYLFSDFQRTNWAEAKFETVPADTRLLFVNTEGSERENLGITSIRFRPATPRIGETVSLACEVFNSAPAARTAPITLSLSTGARFSQTVSLGPYSSATVSFPLQFDTPQRVECTASLPADNLALDDTRRAVIDLRQMPRVLLLTDENAAAPPSASYFLARALHPNPALPIGFRVQTVRPSALNQPLLASADAVVVCNAPQMPEAQYEALARYTTGGGNLVWFLYGDRIGRLIDGLARRLPASEPMPFRVEGVTDLTGNGKGYVTLAEARYESPLLKAFKDPAAADLTRMRFQRICSTTEVDPRAEVLLKFEDGTAAAVRAGEGSGNLLLVNMSPAPAWSDLARQEAFLPLMHEFLKGILARDTGVREFVPGGAASASLPPSPGTKAPRVTCAGPDGDVPAAADPVTGSVVLERVKRSGFYHIDSGGRPAAALAVNPHADESDLRSLDPRELESQRQKELTYLTGMNGRSAGVADLTKGRPLWHYLLLLALLFLFLEQWLGRLKPVVRR